MPQLMHWSDRRISARHLPAGVATKLQLAAFEAWPGNAVSSKMGRPMLGLEGAAIKDAIISVNLRDQLILDVTPVLPEQRQCIHVDRHAIPLHGGSGSHVPPT